MAFGFLKKIFSRKKRESLNDLGEGLPPLPPSGQLALPPPPSQPLQGFNQQESYETANYAPPATPPASSFYETQRQINLPAGSEQLVQKELELISNKIDTLRAEISTINQKLTNLERLSSLNKEKETYKQVNW